jgi:hypothetical protein
MRIDLKLIFLVILGSLALDCHDNRYIKAKEAVPASSYRNIRDNLLPVDPEEMRRQRNLARAANIEWIKESTRKYSPDSWYLLMMYEGLPDMSVASTAGDGAISTHKTENTFHYLRGRSRIDMLASMEKNVHEIAHAYFDQNAFRFVSQNNLKMDPDNAQGYIYISPSAGFFISFPLKAMFPARELTSVIPEDLHTFRFKTYIEGTTSTQSEGLIGLLNELQAYYLGSRYCFDMLEPYKIAAGSSAQGVFEWVTSIQSTMSAYYEFDYFIMEYLLYMKERYPANYGMLRSYNPFAEAYGRIRELYKELIDNYTDHIKTEMKLLNSSGDATARMEKGWLWVRAEKSNVASGTPVFSDPREKLMPLLGSRRYREIENDFDLK